jgi:hypothetical protein
MRYSSIAARRYREHKWEKQKKSIQLGGIVILLTILKTIVNVLQKTGIVRRPTVETVAVE